MTAAENILWRYLCANLVVEFDGPIHEDRRDYDQERDTMIAAHGLTILRFRNDQVRHDPNTVRDRITQVSRESADRATSSTPPRPGERQGSGNTR